MSSPGDVCAHGLDSCNGGSIGEPAKESRQRWAPGGCSAADLAAAAVSHLLLIIPKELTIAFPVLQRLNYLVIQRLLARHAAQLLSLLHC